MIRLDDTIDILDSNRVLETADVPAYVEVTDSITSQQAQFQIVEQGRAIVGPDDGAAISPNQWIEWHGKQYQIENTWPVVMRGRVHHYRLKLKVTTG